MSYDDAVAALEGAVEQDVQSEASEPSMFRPAPAEPVQQAPESSPQGPSALDSAAPQPVAPVTPEAPAPAVDTFDSGQFNPDTLPPELQPAWRQLQAAFTRRTQEVAEQRKQFESFGDMEQLQAATQLYEQVRDPNNWAQLHSELSELMEQNGMTRQMPTSPVAPEPVASVAPALDLSALESDPDLAPLAGVVKGMHDELAQARQQVQAELESIRTERAAAQQETAMASAAAELQRQEAVLLAQGLSDNDLSFVYDLAASPTHQGNLLGAAKQYASMKEAVLSGYLAGKTGIAGTVQAPIAGAGSVSTQAQDRPKNLEQAHDLAMETLRNAGLDTLDW